MCETQKQCDRVCRAVSVLAQMCVSFVYFHFTDIGALVSVRLCVFCMSARVYSPALTINEIIKCLWCVKWQLAAVVT